MISAISKQVFRIFDCAEYFLFKTLLYFLGLVGIISSAEANKVHIMKSLKGVSNRHRCLNKKFLFFKLSLVMNHLSTKFHSIIVSY